MKSVHEQCIPKAFLRGCFLIYRCLITFTPQSLIRVWEDALCIN